MPTNYEFVVRTKINEKKYKTKRNVEGPADLDEAKAIFGEKGVFDGFLNYWKIMQSNKIRAAIAAKVGGKPGAAPEDAESIDLDE